MLIPTALKNWRGLAPEERWRLFTMTNAATGHALHGRGKGWRKAVRFALTENPVAHSRAEPMPEMFRLVAPTIEETPLETVKPRNPGRAKPTPHERAARSRARAVLHRNPVSRLQAFQGKL